jgi:hypothetical protein
MTTLAKTTQELTYRFGTVEKGRAIRYYSAGQFFSAIRTISALTSATVRGRPGVRDALPSYFCAISFRCQAKKVFKCGDCRNPTQQFTA